MENNRKTKLAFKIFMPFVWLLILIGSLRISWEIPIDLWLFHLGLIEHPIFRFDILLYTYLVVIFLVLLIIYGTRKYQLIGSSYKISFILVMIVFVYFLIFYAVCWFDIELRDYKILEFLYG